MKTRLQKLMAFESLTSAKLAEIAGVQPSAVSHILSGRNYPSFEFIANILKAYPTINSRWLLLGEGDIYGQEDKLIEISHPETVKIGKTQDQKNTKPIINVKSLCDNSSSSIDDPKQEAKNLLSTLQPLESQKIIDQIVIFYLDGTFSQYRNK